MVTKRTRVNFTSQLHSGLVVSPIYLQVCNWGCNRYSGSDFLSSSLFDRYGYTKDLVRRVRKKMEPIMF